MELSLISLYFTILLLSAEDSNAQTTNNCGVAPLNTRVVGGADAPVGNWPWQVSIHYSGRHICGGTLIHQDWVLTAAHCILSTDTSKWTLYLGRQHQSGSNPNEVSWSIQAIIIHPNYNNTLYDNDVTLMRLSVSVTLTDYIRPICLAANSSTFYNATSCWATGWGNIGKGVSLPAPQTLQEVEIPVMGSRQCTCVYKPVEDTVITAQMVCAGTNGKGICQGDSGGPLQCKQGSVWVQAGITSFGVPCAVGFPEVFARVSEFQTWITQNTAGSSVGFVTFSSTGTDTDSSYVCPNTTASSAAATPKASLFSSLLVLLSSLIPSAFLTLTFSGVH
ncbi:serine protease 28 isoform X1 [Colossoma macropomum]|uniref:serine protease 28 isoform X1 n=1 Tax=Colossoma macropomum TaxID=42526 RepID=UPI0018651069|nr:serine protease 28 isoform X1 [Colossoma macropomum]